MAGVVQGDRRADRRERAFGKYTQKWHVAALRRKRWWSRVEAWRNKHRSREMFAIPVHIAGFAPPEDAHGQEDDIPTFSEGLGWGDQSGEA